LPIRKRDKLKVVVQPAKPTTNRQHRRATSLDDIRPELLPFVKPEELATLCEEGGGYFFITGADFRPAQGVFKDQLLLNIEVFSEATEEIPTLNCLSLGMTPYRNKLMKGIQGLGQSPYVGPCRLFLNDVNPPGYWEIQTVEIEPEPEPSEGQTQPNPE
jgi:hypothetical protein